MKSFFSERMVAMLSSPPSNSIYTNTQVIREVAVYKTHVFVSVLDGLVVMFIQVDSSHSSLFPSLPRLISR